MASRLLLPRRPPPPLAMALRACVCMHLVAVALGAFGLEFLGIQSPDADAGALPPGGNDGSTGIDVARRLEGKRLLQLNNWFLISAAGFSRKRFSAEQTVDGMLCEFAASRYYSSLSIN